MAEAGLAYHSGPAQCTGSAVLVPLAPLRHFLSLICSPQMPARLRHQRAQPCAPARGPVCQLPVGARHAVGSVPERDTAHSGSRPRHCARLAWGPESGPEGHEFLPLTWHWGPVACLARWGLSPWWVRLLIPFRNFRRLHCLCNHTRPLFLSTLFAVPVNLVSDLD